MTIPLQEAKELPKVKLFLESVSGNSDSTAKIYLVGLAYFQTFLKTKNKDLESILNLLTKNKIDRYSLIQEFINYLKDTKNLSPRSVRNYLTGIKAYLATYRIFFTSQEYKQRVREPKIHRNHEEPLEVSDVRKILLACNNMRLRVFLFVLATGGSRAGETISIRLKDIDFDSVPTKITLRAEYTKTNTERFFFISDESTKQLKEWVEFKYRKRDKEENNVVRKETDYVFVVYDTREPDLEGVYKSLNSEFNNVLKTIAMDDRKEGMLRRKVTFHSLRRFVYSTVSDVDSNFAEWLLGHDHSTYWTKKEAVKKEKYLECMKYLTFLDYTSLESTGKNIESKLLEKDKEIQLLKHQESFNGDAIATLSDQLTKLIEEVEKLKKAD